MSGRDEVISRIKRALKLPAPHPGHQDSNDGAPIDTPPTEGARVAQFVNTLPIIGQNIPAPRAWLPAVGDSWEEQAVLFAAHAADLKANFFVCDSQDDLRANLAQLAAQEKWSGIAAHGGDLMRSALGQLGLPILWTDDGYDKIALERCSVGITLCDALVAQTGSVLVTSKSAGGRVLSVLPPHHVVLATRAQLVPDLPTAFELLQSKYGEAYPSMISFITGPSRTGDIERILVLGAHGPKKLSIFCV
jgi:L-lactate dehydrogenase complex protein LldG